MRVLNKLHLTVSGKKTVIDIGQPDTPAEMDECMRLRFRQYVRKGYIDPSRFPDGKERDEFDEKAVYFMARFEGKIIGFVRLIAQDVLPTEMLFDFDPPAEIVSIPRQKRAELGRLIIVPPDAARNIYLPRNVVLLLMSHAVTRYGLEHDIQGGYIFIKKSLGLKLAKLKIPIRRIESFTQKCSEDDILYPYFTQKEDPVAPYYFLVREVYGRLSKLLKNRLLFEQTGENIWTLRETGYSMLLRRLKII